MVKGSLAHVGSEKGIQIMKAATALGIAFASLAMAAYAQPEHSRVIVRHGGGPGLNMDSDGDGWLTRAEAGAGAERMFADLDSNHDGRLSSEDHPAEALAPGLEGELEDDNCTTNVEPGEGRERRITVICRDEGEASESERRVERRVHIERHGEPAAPRAEAEGERRVEREVTIIHGDGAAAPHAPHAPHAPMFMMLLANSEESDLNGDGAISRDEFRAQHLRFFDASDVNGDSRVRFDSPHWDAPAPPEPPAPPAPPERPR